MLIEKHIAYRFLTDDKFAWEIVDHQHPGWEKPYIGKFDPEKENLGLDVDNATADIAMSTYRLVNNSNQRSYYITETVLDKLELLKVNKNVEYNLRFQNGKEILGQAITYDWSVFRNSTKHPKVTFILPNNSLIRIMYDRQFIVIFFLRVLKFDWDRNHADIFWTMMWIDSDKKEASSNWPDKDVQEHEELIYKIMCFFYLSENEEMILKPGEKHGTKKQGKIINKLPIPLTLVTSKWNVTSIRTEGFDVSGHFRLQPTKSGTIMKWINPFRKHGYVRRAKKDNEL